jgi:hypothetical protein
VIANSQGTAQSHLCLSIQLLLGNELALRQSTPCSSLPKTICIGVFSSPFNSVAARSGRIFLRMVWAACSRSGRVGRLQISLPVGPEQRSSRPAHMSAKTSTASDLSRRAFLISSPVQFFTPFWRPPVLDKPFGRPRLRGGDSANFASCDSADRPSACPCCVHVASSVFIQP